MNTQITFTSNVTVVYTSPTRKNWRKVIQHQAGDVLRIEVLDNVPSTEFNYFWRKPNGSRWFGVIPGNQLGNINRQVL